MLKVTDAELTAKAKVKFNAVSCSYKNEAVNVSESYVLLSITVICLNWFSYLFIEVYSWFTMFQVYRKVT